jgi:hypothetical protein
MRKLAASILAIFVALFVVALSSAPGHAQAARTWVSGVGDDANPCSRTAPCKTFAGAISKTAAFGEINCLDPGGFGAVTITKSISIICQAGTAGVLVAGTNGITVAVAATDRVVLDGLDFEGLHSGLDGVQMTTGGKLIIRNCTIRNFNNNGVEITAPAASPAPRVLIQNSLITGNAGGFNVAGSGGASINGEVLNTLIDTNTSFGIQVAAGGDVVLAGSSVTGNAPSIIVSGGGQVVSYGNNVLRNAGTPTSTLPLQ